MVRDEKLLPKEIRAIRESLGLSQVEAGKVIGGGPRAFTKYENWIYAACGFHRKAAPSP